MYIYFIKVICETQCSKVSKYCSMFKEPEVILVKQNQYLKLENHYLQILFDQQTYLPREIVDASQGIRMHLEMQIIRHREQKSESGAYIFAPGFKEMMIKLQPTDVYFFESTISSQVLVFYKSPYKTSCFAVLSLSLDCKGDMAHSPQFRFKSFPLDYDDLFLRIQLRNVNNSQLSTHNSIHFQKRTINFNKRLLSSRDLGSQMHPTSTGCSLKVGNYTLLLSTGDRPVGVASYKPGQLNIGLGRKNRFDDDKGLPDGVVDNHPYQLIFGLKLFGNQMSQAKIDQYFDFYQQPLLNLKLEGVYLFQKNQISFSNLLNLAGQQLLALTYEDYTYKALYLNRTETIQFQSIELNSDRMPPKNYREEYLFMASQYPQCYLEN